MLGVKCWVMGGECWVLMICGNGVLGVECWVMGGECWVFMICGDGVLGVNDMWEWGVGGETYIIIMA